MHETGLVHRDIKPKNVMLFNARPVIIDFEFAQFGDHLKGDDVSGTTGRTSRVCVVQPGTMGKTVFEVTFRNGEELEASSMVKREITELASEEENELFRALLSAAADGGTIERSRFRLTSYGRDRILEVICAL
mmetsp:Transcript_24332/g.29422  ORF Transcript_24332/g.29422 Transcript_24332/m.29422 type:complete len:133 (-) Transcript_24332:344-742(-)